MVKLANTTNLSFVGFGLEGSSPSSDNLNKCMKLYYILIKAMNLKNTNTINPVYSYNNPYEERAQIYKDIKGKTGIYLWTNTISGKSYVGSAVDLRRRLSNYFSKVRIKSELETTKSLIYKAILKYDYSNFKLDIIEICNIESLLEREQYYLDNFELKYNTLKTAGSLLGFKHSAEAIELIRASRLGKPISEEAKIKLAANSQAYALEVLNIHTNLITYFSSIRRAAEYMNMHHSYLAKCLNKNGFYKGRNYYVIKYVENK